MLSIGGEGVAVRGCDGHVLTSVVAICVQGVQCTRAQRSWRPKITSHLKTKLRRLNVYTVNTQLEIQISVQLEDFRY